MTHWSFREMKECFGFTLGQYLYYGAYPGAAVLIGDGGIGVEEFLSMDIVTLF